MLNRLILFVAIGFTLTGCASYMPSFGFLRSPPSTEQLRIESEPTGAQASAGSQGSTCQTPCELAVHSDTEILVAVAMNGYQPVTVMVRPEGGRLQPNPVYAELHPFVPVTPAKRPSAKRNPKQAEKVQ
jgi:hypothetical protein